MIFLAIKSSVGKTMATVHFTTTPCGAYTAHKVQGKQYFCNICPPSCANDILHARFEDFATFLYVFMNVIKVFVREELWVNIPVTIFFPAVDW